MALAKGPLAMQMPMGQAAAAPVPQLAPQGPGAQDLLMEFAKKKALEKGAARVADAAMPGSGLAAEALLAAAPAFFNEGGKADDNATKIDLSSVRAKPAAPVRPAPDQKKGQIDSLLGALSVLQGFFNQGGRVGADTFGSPAVYKDEGGAVEAQLRSKGLDEDSIQHYMMNWRKNKDLKTKYRADGGRMGADTFGSPAVYRNEGGPMINPAHKGKFTAKAQSAGEGVQEYARKVLAAPEGRYDPATRKQANFARNAAAWHKEDGGRIGPLAKSSHKMPDGTVMENTYHNPLAGDTHNKK